MTAPANDGRAFCRLKGGVKYDPSAGAFRTIIHFWSNGGAIGPPKEWQSVETFPTEEAAMEHYKTKIQPRLKSVAEQAARGRGITFKNLMDKPSDRQNEQKTSPR